MYESSEEQELYDYLSDPEVRHLYLDSSIRDVLAMQIRSMREARRLSQVEVGEKAGGMKQAAIARLEDPTYSGISLTTLKRLAEAFDVALTVRFSPFSEFISWTAKLDENQFAPPSFNEDTFGGVQLPELKSVYVDANNNSYELDNSTASTSLRGYEPEKEKIYA